MEVEKQRGRNAHLEAQLLQQAGHSQPHGTAAPASGAPPVHVAPPTAGPAPGGPQNGGAPQRGGGKKRGYSFWQWVAGVDVMDAQLEGQ